MKTRVMIGTPVYGGVTTAYMLGLADLLLNQDETVEYVPCLVRGTYVNCSRNDIVREARKQNCEELIFVDSDIEFTAAHIRQLRSHDVPVVGGIYAKRIPGEPQWPVHLSGEEPKGTLVRANDAPTGLLRIKMSVFDALDSKFHHRRYQHKGEEPRTEYFPLSLCMPGTHEHPAEAILRRIRSILSDSERSGASSAILREIIAVMQPESPEKDVLPELVGEDCGFCRLLRAAGIPVYVDLAVRVPHVGEARFPLTEHPL